MTTKKATTKGGAKGSTKGKAEGSQQGSAYARLARNIYAGSDQFDVDGYFTRVFEQLSMAKDHPDVAGAILFNVFDELDTLAEDDPDTAGTCHEQARLAAYCLTAHFHISADELRKGLAEGGGVLDIESGAARRRALERASAGDE